MSGRCAVPTVSCAAPAAESTPVPTVSLEAVLPEETAAVHSVLNAGQAVHVPAGSFGIAHFYSTRREPRLVPGADQSGPMVLSPHYDIINQTSLDAQYTIESWLVNLEAMTHSGQGDTFFAAAGGFEYTFFRMTESDADLGLDTELLAGVIFDHDQEERIFSLEFKRRLTDHLNLEVEGQFYDNVDSGDVLGGLASDSFIEM